MYGQYRFTREEDRVATLSNWGLTVAEAADSIMLYDSGASADNKRFRIKSDDGVLYFLKVLDDLSGSTTLFTWDNAAGELKVQGDIEATGDLAVGVDANIVGAITADTITVAGNVVSQAGTSTFVEISVTDDIAAGGNISSTAGSITTDSGNISAVAGNVSGVDVQVNGILKVDDSGIAAMAAGTIAVGLVSLAATDVVLVTPQFAPAGRLSVAMNAGVGFTINSSDGGDAGDIGYLVVRPV